MSDVFVPTPAEQELADREREVYNDVVVTLKETKTGWKTTEFWMTLVGAALVNLNVVPLPEKYEGFVTAGLVGLYALARGLSKAGVPTVDDTKKV